MVSTPAPTSSSLGPNIGHNGRSKELISKGQEVLISPGLGIMGKVKLGGHNLGNDQRERWTGQAAATAVVSLGVAITHDQGVG